MQERFCQEFTRDRNATQAAIRAGYAPRSAKSCGNRLMTQDDIKKRIAEITAELDAETQITPQWVRTEIARIAMDPEVMPRDQLKALEMLARMMGLFEPKQEDGGNVVRYVYGDDMEELAV